MNLRERFLWLMRGEWLPGGELPPKLRNKPGGMAWIKPHSHGTGAEELFGQVVTTVRADANGFWTLEPRPSYTSRARQIDPCGTVAEVGQRVTVAIHDNALEPIPDTGVTREEVEKLYAGGPTLIPLQVKGEVKAK